MQRGRVGDQAAAPEDIPGIQIHESILIRIRDYLSSQSPVLR
jgi:hypothetical protein